MADRKTVPGSERRLEPTHPRVGDVDGSAEIEVTVYVRGPRAEDDDLRAVSEFADEHGLEVVSSERPRRASACGARSTRSAPRSRRSCRGCSSIPRAYGTEGAQGPLTVPAELDGVITSVLGIDNRPRPSRGSASRRTRRRTYTPVEVGQAYSFPAQATGEGETVGIIELGGGFDTADLDAVFPGARAHAARRDRGQRRRGHQLARHRHNADGEVMLDIEVVGAVAPARRSSCTSRPTPTRVHRRGLHRGPRHHQPAVGGLDQLGRPRGHLDRAGP